MTSVLLNRVGTDIVDLNVNQVGSPETTIILRQALLDDKKDYRFAVSSLSVPMQNIDMFGFLTTPAQELFTIQRRTYRSLLTEYSAEQAAFETTVENDVVDYAASTAVIRVLESKHN